MSHSRDDYGGVNMNFTSIGIEVKILRGQGVRRATHLDNEITLVNSKKHMKNLI